MRKLVIFDFDGVLANTTELNYKIHKDVNGNLTWEKFQQFSEVNFFEGMGKAIKDEKYIIPPKFFEIYEKNLSLINIHDILRDSILELRKKYRLAIVSACRSDSISNFLQKQNIRNCFDDILGIDNHTSKVVKIKSLLEKYKVLPKDAVFVTDTLGDILEGKSCGIYSIAVTWGLHSKETLKKGAPSKIIDEPSDLFGTIEDVLK